MLPYQRAAHASIDAVHSSFVFRLGREFPGNISQGANDVFVQVRRLAFHDNCPATFKQLTACLRSLFPPLWQGKLPLQKCALCFRFGCAANSLVITVREALIRELQRVLATATYYPRM